MSVLDTAAYNLNSDRFNRISGYLTRRVNLPDVEPIDFDQSISQLQSEIDRLKCIKKCYELYDVVKSNKFVKTQIYDYIYALSCNIFQYIENPNYYWSEGKLNNILTTTNLDNWLNIDPLLESLPGRQIAFIDILENKFRVCGFRKWCRSNMATCNYTTFIKDELPFIHKTETEFGIYIESIPPVLERIEDGVRIHFAYSSITPKDLMTTNITELTSPDSVKNVFLRWVKRDIPEPFANAFLDCLPIFHKLKKISTPLNEELNARDSNTLGSHTPKKVSSLTRSVSLDDIRDTSIVINTNNSSMNVVDNTITNFEMTEVENSSELSSTIDSPVSDISEYLIPEESLKSLEELKSELLQSQTTPIEVSDDSNSSFVNLVSDSDADSSQNSTELENSNKSISLENSKLTKRTMDTNTNEKPVKKRKEVRRVKKTVVKKIYILQRTSNNS